MSLWVKTMAKLTFLLMQPVLKAFDDTPCKLYHRYVKDCYSHNKSHFILYKKPSFSQSGSGSGSASDASESAGGFMMAVGIRGFLGGGSCRCKCNGGSAALRRRPGMRPVVPSVDG